MSPPSNETILPLLIGDQLENLIPDKNPSSYYMDHMIIRDFQYSIQTQDLYTLIEVEFYDFVYSVYCVVNVGWKVQDAVMFDYSSLASFHFLTSSLIIFPEESFSFHYHVATRERGSVGEMHFGYDEN